MIDLIKEYLNIKDKVDYYDQVEEKTLFIKNKLHNIIDEYSQEHYFNARTLLLLLHKITSEDYESNKDEIDKSRELTVKIYNKLDNFLNRNSINEFTSGKYYLIDNEYKLDEVLLKQGTSSKYCYYYTEGKRYIFPKEYLNNGYSIIKIELVDNLLYITTVIEDQFIFVVPKEYFYDEELRKS